jgi:hypothetical protein
MLVQPLDNPARERAQAANWMDHDSPPCRGAFRIEW